MSSQSQNSRLASPGICGAIGCINDADFVVLNDHREIYVCRQHAAGKQTVRRVE